MKHKDIKRTVNEIDKLRFQLQQLQNELKDSSRTMGANDDNADLDEMTASSLSDIIDEMKKLLGSVDNPFRR